MNARIAPPAIQRFVKMIAKMDFPLVAFVNIKKGYSSPDSNNSIHAPLKNRKIPKQNSTELPKALM